MTAQAKRLLKSPRDLIGEYVDKDRQVAGRFNRMSHRIQIAELIANELRGKGLENVYATELYGELAHVPDHALEAKVDELRALTEIDA